MSVSTQLPVVVIPAGNHPLAPGRRLVSSRTVRLGKPVALLVLAVTSIFCSLTIVPSEESLSALAQIHASDSHQFLHVTGSLRVPAGSGTTIPSAHAEMVPVEIYFCDVPTASWSITLPQMIIAAKSGKSALIYKTPEGKAHLQPVHYNAYPQIPFIGHFMWGRELFEIEESIAHARNINIRSEIVSDETGKEQLKFTIPAKVTGDVPKMNSQWFNPLYAKTYTFDRTTQNLESVRVTTFEAGREIVIFETDSIKYLPDVAAEPAISRTVERYSDLVEVVRPSSFSTSAHSS